MTAHGAGLEKNGVTVNKWAEFTVDARRGGKAPLHVAAMDADYNTVDVIIKDNKDGTYTCRYMPKKNIKHTIMISWGGVTIPNSPYRVSLDCVVNYTVCVLSSVTADGNISKFLLVLLS